MEMQTEIPFAPQYDHETRQDAAGLSSLQDADESIQAFVEVFEISPASKPAQGPLSGITFGVKEILEQEGRKSPWGVDFLHDRAGLRTAHCVADLERLGAKRLGTTRSTLMAIVGESATRNPRDLTRSPGGSSAGSAAGVAAGFVDFALGTQTVGSIIRPASYCGVSGFKPTFGRIDTDGAMPLARELDHVGLIAKDVATIKAVTQALAFQDAPSASFDTVLVPRIWFDEPVDLAVWNALENTQRDLENIGLKSFDFKLPRDVVSAEEEVLNGLLYKGIHDNHAQFIRDNRSRLPAELVEFERRGQSISSVEHEALQARQRELCAIMLEAVHPGAVLLCPSVSDVPPLIGQGTGSRTPQRVWTLLGWPSLGIPRGYYAQHLSHLSVGVQLLAPPMQDAQLLDLGLKLQCI